MPDGSGRMVLITRPEPGASETAARIAALGMTPVIAPMLVIASMPARLPPPERVGTILLTSGNAVGAFTSAYHGRLVWAVGRATAARAQAAGFHNVRSADGDAIALAAAIAADPAADAPFLLATARRQGGLLCRMLRNHGLRVVRRVVYAARPATAFPTEAGETLRCGAMSAALFFSTETARTFVHLVRAGHLANSITDSEAVAISRRVAMALEPLPWRRIRVAEQPNQDAMLALL